MSIANDARHRARWIQKVAHIVGQIIDLQSEVDIAIGTSPGRTIEELLLEADVHLELAIRELDTARARMRSIV